MPDSRHSTPTSWRRRALGELLASVEAGVSANGGERPARANEHGILTLTAVVTGHFDSHANKVIESDYLERLGRPLCKDTVLISRSNTLDLVGRTAFVDRDYPCLHLPDLLWALRVKDVTEMVPHWLHYSLSAPNQRQCLMAIASGTSANMKKLSIGRIKRLQIELPPREEQIQHVRILRTWDQAELATSRLIRAWRKLKRGLLQQLLTGQSRFPEFRRSDKFRSTRYGRVPDDWTLTTIGAVAKEATTRATAMANAPVLSCTKHKGLVSSVEYFGRRVHSEDVSDYKLVQRGEFAYATNHIEEGSIGYLADREAGVVSPMYTVFQTSGLVDGRFLFALLKTEHYRQIYQARTNASVDRRGGLRWDEFAKIPLALPTRPEQGRIAEVLVECDRELSLLRQLYDALRKQKKGLMQKLLTGQIRVPASMLKEAARV